MARDPIIEEIHQVRDAHAAEHGYDPLKIARALQAEEKARGLATVTREPKAVPGRRSEAG